jgi:hypothetical protein
MENKEYEMPNICCPEKILFSLKLLFSKELCESQTMLITNQHSKHWIRGSWRAEKVRISYPSVAVSHKYRIELQLMRISAGYHGDRSNFTVDVSYFCTYWNDKLSLLAYPNFWVEWLTHFRHVKDENKEAGTVFNLFHTRHILALLCFLFACLY